MIVHLRLYCIIMAAAIPKKRAHFQLHYFGLLMSILHTILLTANHVGLDYPTESRD